MTIETLEIWRDIPGWDCYRISSFGTVVRKAGTPMCKMDRVLKTHVGSTGYPSVHLQQDGREKQILVHMAVAISFMSEKPSHNHELAHGDGDSTNPRLSNLRWATRSENASDKILHGTHLFGQGHPSSVLSDDEVDKIRAMRRGGQSYTQIAERFRITPAHARRIAIGVSRAARCAA